MGSGEEISLRRLAVEISLIHREANLIIPLPLILLLPLAMAVGTLDHRPVVAISEDRPVVEILVHRQTAATSVAGAVVETSKKSFFGETIFLDMDGVLYDFVGGVLRAFQLETSVYDIRTFWLQNMPGTYETEKVLSAYLGKHITDQDMWDKIDVLGNTFWTSLKTFPWARDLYDLSCRLVGQENVHILSSPARDPVSASGKLQALANFLPPSARRNYILTKHKHYCAGDGRILLDDYPEHIDHFDAHGGYGILVPQPWNDLHMLAEKTYTHLNEKLVQLCTRP